MRNVFDQYSQPENRVTHALMTALNEDRALLGRFLRDLANITPPCHPGKLSVLEQQYPDELEASEDELERRGIPDGWIFDDDGWCVFIEIKVTAKLLASQIGNHRRAAERQKFRHIKAIAIVAQSNVPCPPNTVLLEWRHVYAWLCDNRRQSQWAARTATYLEIAEVQLIDRKSLVEGTLTMFSGFPYGLDNPFTYTDGKRVLRLACDELLAHKDHKEFRRELGVAAEYSRRGAIKGRTGDHIWDFLALEESTETKDSTKFPHLTLGINRHEVSAMLTIPDKVAGGARRNLSGLSEVEFQKAILAVARDMTRLSRKEINAVPWFSGAQRHWPSRSGEAVIDARIEFDLRTAIPGSKRPKSQPLWLSAAYDSFVNRRGTNYELQIGARFPYDRCKELNDPGALELITGAWRACKPVVDLLRA